MTPLFAHQKTGIAFLKHKKKVILADEMGLGKSRQAVVAAGEESLLVRLVICPASLKINWQREIHEIYSNHEVYVVGSGKEKDLPESEWIVINYDMLPKYKDQIMALKRDGKTDTVIVDEAHYIKGKSTIRTKDTMEVIKGMKNVYMLTGTPLLNRPAEMFNLLRAIEHPLGKIRTSFVRRYCGGQQKVMVMDMVTRKRFFVTPDKYYSFNPPRYKRFFFTDDTGATHMDELKEFIKDSFIRRTKKEELDLPPKIITYQTLELSPEGRRQYDTAWETYVSWIERNPDASRNVEDIKGAQQLIEVGKLKQVCSSAKVSRITSDVENAIEQGEKVIIFTQFTATISNLMESMNKSGIKAVRLAGMDSMSDRQKSIDSFQDPDGASVFIANIKAGGVGVNLTAASIVMFADMDWSPGINAQAEDRAHRIGQKGTVNVYYYICNDTVEEEIVKIVREKAEIISNIMGDTVVPI